MDQYKAETNAIIDEVIAITIETEGAFGREEVYHMSANERYRVALYLEKKAKAKALAQKHQ